MTLSAAKPAKSTKPPVRDAQGGRRGRAHLVPTAAFVPLLTVLAALLVVAVLVAISVGSVQLPLRTVWSVVAQHTLHLQPSAAIDRRDDAIIWNFRAPRALLAVVVGAGLAVAGTALQALVRNPLADPYVLGVVQGGSFGAVLAIGVGTAAVGKLALSGSAFVGAMVCLLLVLMFGRRHGRVSSARLVLAGVAVGYVFQAGTSFVQLQMSDGNSLAGVLFWLLGTVAGASWGDLGVPSVVVLLAMGWLIVQARPLNALLMGDESAIALGIRVSRFRIQLTVVASVLTGCVVAVAGGVGFVGLMIPHAARLLVGADHRRMLPVTALGGGLFLVAVDVLARTLARPLELPLSVITAAVGAPFFLWLMSRSDRTPGVA